MNHEMGAKSEKDHAALLKSKIGLILFFVYSLIYAGFVFINTLTPKTMTVKIVGLNLAVVYGFGLIVLAIVMGVLYNHYCTRLEDRMNPSSGKEEDQ